MTSSLVGSEMCIRDSPNLHHRVMAQQTHTLHGPSPTAAVCGFSAASIPVSYTHLTLPTICSV
eukprot:3378715-Prorocentrum_lima.AAC.1